MTCEEVRGALLEAEPEELHASAAGPLALHLRQCAACRADAEAVLAGTAVLRSAMAAAAANGAAWPGNAADDVADHERVQPRRRWRSGARVLVPLALAAGLGALVLLSSELVRLPFGERPLVDVYVPRTEVPDAPVVNAAGGSGVAVMSTADPEITVVWTF